MIGVARTSSAITIVNALPTGVGSAVGIGLYVEAEVRVRTEPSVGPPSFSVPTEVSSPLVVETLRAALARFFPAGGIVAELSLRSEVPMGRGLKSSSAVGTAILLAVARAAGAAPPALEVARDAAEVARSVGVSATGALDDAFAGLRPGRIVTQNLERLLLRHDPPDTGLGVALYVPRAPHPPSPDLLNAFAAEREAGAVAVNAALRGDWVRAMRLNTELVERTMGYRYEGLRERLESSGAVASGVSGLGPTLAAVAPPDALARLVDVFPSDDADRMTVGFTEGSAESWGGR